MHYITLTTAATMAILVATSNAAATLNGRQVVPPVAPGPWCTNWKPSEDDHPNTCGQADDSSIYCLNGRLCIMNLHFSDEDMQKEVDKTSCHCPDDCTTDGNGDCV